MTLPDLVNGSFELFASGFIALNAFTTWRHRQATGVHWAAVSFFTTWGLWNIFYYPHLGQTFSFVGGLAVCIANLVYLHAVWKFRPQQERAV